MKTIKVVLTINLNYEVPNDFSTQHAAETITDQINTIIDHCDDMCLWILDTDLRLASKYHELYILAPDEPGRVYWVDVPNPYNEDYYLNVGTFFSYDEAIAFAKEEYGADENGCINLISIGEAADYIKEE